MIGSNFVSKIKKSSLLDYSIYPGFITHKKVKLIMRIELAITVKMFRILLISIEIENFRYVIIVTTKR